MIAYTKYIISKSLKGDFFPSFWGKPPIFRGKLTVSSKSSGT